MKYLVFLSLFWVSLANAIVIDDSPSSLLTTYNVISLGDYSTTSHSEGRFMVVGDFASSSSVSGAPNIESVPSDEYSVVVGGSVNGSMTINSGSVLVSTNGVNSGATLTNQDNHAEFTSGGYIQLNGGGDIILDSTLDLSSVASSLIDFSDSLSLLESDSTTSLYVSDSGNLLGELIDTNGDGVVVATLSYADLASISNNNDKSLLSALSDITGLLINVTGTASDLTEGVELQNDGWDDIFASKVLFNFVDAGDGDTISIGGSKFWGSILAPEADLEATNVIEGTVIANDIEHGGQEIHLPTLDEDFANALEGLVVPEPSAYALILGVLSLGFVASRRRR
jgi:choice-of-anchor A domain-containing protein